MEADEQPEWKRPQPKVDFSKIDRSDPEGMLKMTKQGKTLMMFATVSGNVGIFNEKLAFYSGQTIISQDSILGGGGGGIISFLIIFF